MVLTTATSTVTQPVSSGPAPAAVAEHVSVVNVVTTGGRVVTLGEKVMLVLELATDVYSVAVGVALHAIGLRDASA